MLLYTASVLLIVGGVDAAGVDFSRYSLILDRRPFAAADLVDESASQVVTLEAPPAFVRDLRMCAITESPAGIRVGFVNISAKPPQPYYLYVGDSEDGIELIEADYERECALLRKGGEQYWLPMGGDSLGGGAPPAAGAPSPPPTRGSSPPALPRVSSASGKDGSISYAERRRRRLAEMRERAAAARDLSEAEVEKRLREYQMNLIRKGMTPLPIQLTPEMDAQLVKEGVLPAVEPEPVQ